MTVRRTKAVVLALAFVLGGCEQQPELDQHGNLIGPIHSSERLSRQDLAGVRPGMRLDQAAAILAVQGYVPMPRTPEAAADDESGVIKRRYFWIAAQDGTDAHRFPQTVRLSHALRGNESEVMAVGFFQRITPQERRNVDASRQAITGRHGRPSLWRQDVYRGELWDEMDYVALPGLRSQEGLERLRACHADWQCEKVAKKFDCRETMRAARHIALRVSFGQEGNRIYYELSDYRRLHDAHLRDGKLSSLSLRGAFCAVESPDGVRTMVAHPE
jgi:hypothetical protein